MNETNAVIKRGEKWLLWQDGAGTPFYNMAADEMLLKKSAACGIPILRFYSWDRASVSIGYVQKFSAAPSNAYTVVRRFTGGGVVFHEADLTYTVAVPASHAINRMDRLESYNFIHAFIMNAFSKYGMKAESAEKSPEKIDRSTMQCFTTPTRYDILSSGRKIAGSAQRRTRDGLLHQGSIIPGEVSKDGLIAEIRAAFRNDAGIEFEIFEASADFMAEIRNLADSKYASFEWNHLR